MTQTAAQNPDGAATAYIAERQSAYAALEAAWATQGTNPKRLNERIGGLVSQFYDLELVIGQWGSTVAQAEEALALREAQLTLLVQGSNETMRKAQLVQDCAADADYCAAQEQLLSARATLADREAEHARLRREWQALQLQLETRLAQIRFIGG